MKRLFIILFFSIAALPVIGQSNLHRKAEKCFNEFEFGSAAVLYKKIIKKNPADHAAIARLDQCYRFLSYKSEFKALLPPKKNQSAGNIPVVP